LTLPKNKSIIKTGKTLMGCENMGDNQEVISENKPIEKKKSLGKLLIKLLLSGFIIGNLICIYGYFTNPSSFDDPVEPYLKEAREDYFKASQAHDKEKMDKAMEYASKLAKLQKNNHGLYVYSVMVGRWLALAFLIWLFPFLNALKIEKNMKYFIFIAYTLFLLLSVLGLTNAKSTPLDTLLGSGIITLGFVLIAFLILGIIKLFKLIWKF
jgi:hypothetical protein